MRAQILDLTGGTTGSDYSETNLYQHGLGSITKNESDFGIFSKPREDVFVISYRSGHYVYNNEQCTCTLNAHRNLSF